MENVFRVLIPFSMAAVLAALAFGIFALFKGGDFGRSWSNRAMRLRVVAQAVAIVVLLAAVWAHQNLGG